MDIRMNLKNFCGVLCKRCMYIIPPSKCENENGFPDGWGVRSALPRSFFFRYILWVSYYETLLHLLPCAMGDTGHVLTESLTECQYQCDNAHIMRYPVPYIYVIGSIATPLTEQVSRSKIRCYG